MGSQDLIVVLTQLRRRASHLCRSFGELVRGRHHFDGPQLRILHLLEGAAATEVGMLIYLGLGQDGTGRDTRLGQHQQGRLVIGQALEPAFHDLNHLIATGKPVVIGQVTRVFNEAGPVHAGAEPGPGTFRTLPGGLDGDVTVFGFKNSHGEGVGVLLPVAVMEGDSAVGGGVGHPQGVHEQ